MFSASRCREICKYLFGSEVGKEDGVSIVSGGLLSAISESDFDRKLQKLKTKDGDAYAWWVILL